jgi:hypothetical protein
MIPPPRYRQQTNAYSRSLLLSFMSEDENIEYILEEDGLRVQTVFRNRFSFIKYSDMETIRLDYEQTGGKNRPTKRQFLCHINEDTTIKTEWLSSGGIFLSKQENLEYNKFVEMLHLKLQNAPNEARTFHTGWTQYSYNLQCWIIAGASLVAICVGIFSLMNGGFEPFWIFFCVMILIFSGSATMDHSPTPYSPRHIPSRFLS